MTDFRQRQAVSTLTAPAARGLTPHYLVQPDDRPAHHPATERLLISKVLYRRPAQKARVILLFFVIIPQNPEQ